MAAVPTRQRWSASNRSNLSGDYVRLLLHVFRSCSDRAHGRLIIPPCACFPLYSSMRGSECFRNLRCRSCLDHEHTEVNSGENQTRRADSHILRCNSVCCTLGIAIVAYHTYLVDADLVPPFGWMETHPRRPPCTLTQRTIRRRNSRTNTSGTRAQCRRTKST